MKNKKDNLSELLGYEPGREQRLIILKEVKETGKSIAEVADKYAMPPLFLLDDSGIFEYKGEKMLPKQFKERFPHRRFVIIGTKKELEKLHQLENIEEKKEGK
jgi:hypothetical protein